MAKILLLTTHAWHSTSLIVISLLDAGFRVAVLCPTDHSVRLVERVEVIQECTGRAWLIRLRRMVDDWAPDLVVPGDDEAVTVLHQAHAVWSAKGYEQGVSIIERSIGDPRYYDITTRKGPMLALASEANLGMPRTCVVDDERAVREAVRTGKFPCIVKQDGLWGGYGVHVVNSADEAVTCFRKCMSPPSLVRTAIAMLRSRSLEALRRRLTFVRPSVAVQEFVKGSPANIAVVCQAGRTIASASVEVLQTKTPFGNATVVRSIDASDMVATATYVVKKLGLSGFVGFDFILHPDNRSALLLEMNARVTATCYAVRKGQLSLAAALFEDLQATAGGRPASAPITICSDAPHIALFPQELERDSSSPFLEGSSHTVPTHEPRFVEELYAQLGWPHVRDHGKLTLIEKPPSL